MSIPKVSVIIPTYNRAHFIAQAVESVLMQTYQDFELIIIDDGSTDNTKEVLESYRDRLHYFYQENQGRSVARNRGIELAKGEYIAFLDSDDLWLPNKLSRQVPILETSDLDIVLVHGYKQVVDTHLSPVPGWEIEKLRKCFAPAVENKQTYEAFIQGICPLFTSTVLVRKSATEVVGGYDPELKALEDLDFYLRLLLNNYKFAFLGEPAVILYRCHSGNTDALLSNLGYLKVYQKHLSLCQAFARSDNTSKAKSLIYWQLFYTHRRLKQHLNSFRCYLQSIKYYLISVLNNLIST